MLFGKKHVERYEATGGEEGHDWQGTTTLILTTTGRRSGEQRPTPLIYQQHGDAYLVVASDGGADQPPAWYRNLEADPEVHVQVKADRFPARARDATAGGEARDVAHHDRAPGPPTTTTSRRPSGRSRWSCWSARASPFPRCRTTGRRPTGRRCPPRPRCSGPRAPAPRRRSSRRRRSTTGRRTARRPGGGPARRTGRRARAPRRRVPDCSAASVSAYTTDEAIANSSAPMSTMRPRNACFFSSLACQRAMA